MLLKITEKFVRENAFEQKKKKPGLRANRPSNNWAQNFWLVFLKLFVLADYKNLAKEFL